MKSGRPGRVVGTEPFNNEYLRLWNDFNAADQNDQDNDNDSKNDVNSDILHNLTPLLVVQMGSLLWQLFSQRVQAVCLHLRKT